MKTRDFSFNLPEELIAQHPAHNRGESRLLTLNRETGQISHHMMVDFPEILPSGALLIFNNTRVRKARLFARTEGGGTVEFLLLRDLGENRWEVVVQRRKRQQVGRRYRFPENLTAELVVKPEGLGILQFETAPDEGYFERNGNVPLPPYIRREGVASDDERYQTIYSRETGSVAAPTAGLHFTDSIMDAIRLKAETEYVTLHVGIGTFSPIRTENLSDHRMHREEYEISRDTADKVWAAKEDGRPVIAVGTTTVRTLESAWTADGLRTGRNSTELFISPGYRFKVVDKMFTNFHTPESSLLVMVSAFAGRETILNTYAAAVKAQYRFFSYGDAMFIQ